MGGVFIGESESGADSRHRHENIFFRDYGGSLAAEGLDGVEVGGAAGGERDGDERREDE